MEFIRQKHRQTVGTDSGTLHLHTIHTPGESPAFSRDADGGVEMLQIHSKTWRVLVSERRALLGKYTLRESCSAATRSHTLCPAASESNICRVYHKSKTVVV
jgi:hypothetical protein